MKTMIVAAAAVFMLTGAAAAGVPAKAVIAKDARPAEAMLVHNKPGSSRGGGGAFKVCTPFGCKTVGSGWGS